MSVNDVTGDSIISKAKGVESKDSAKKYRDNYDAIFRKGGNAGGEDVSKEENMENYDGG